MFWITPAREAALSRILDKLVLPEFHSMFAQNGVIKVIILIILLIFLGKPPGQLHTPVDFPQENKMIILIILHICDMRHSFTLVHRL